MVDIYNWVSIKYRSNCCSKMSLQSRTVAHKIKYPPLPQGKQTNGFSFAHAGFQVTQPRRKGNKGCKRARRKTSQRSTAKVTECVVSFEGVADPRRRADQSDDGPHYDPGGPQ